MPLQLFLLCDPSIIEKNISMLMKLVIFSTTIFLEKYLKLKDKNLLWAGYANK